MRPDEHITRLDEELDIMQAEHHVYSLEAVKVWQQLKAKLKYFEKVVKKDDRKDWS